MAEPPIVRYVCTRETFRPVPCEQVRWLAPQADFYRYQQMLQTRGVAPPTLEEWLEWHAQGYSFAASVHQGTIRAIAAVLKHSESDWELAGVRTLEAHQRQGHGTAVSSFLTEYILSRQQRAICHTHDDNLPMRRILDKLGYR